MQDQNYFPVTIAVFTLVLSLRNPSQNVYHYFYISILKLKYSNQIKDQL